MRSRTALTVALVAATALGSVSPAMRTRTALIAVLAAATSAALAAPAVAAPPKPFTQVVSYTDATPDPTGNTADTDSEHCKGLLPMEAPIKVKVPGPGDVDVTLAITGDWTLMITDAAGNVLGGADVNPPENESTSARLKKAQTINIYPCNLAGVPTAKVTIKYTYRK